MTLDEIGKIATDTLRLPGHKRATWASDPIAWCVDLSLPDELLGVPSRLALYDAGDDYVEFALTVNHRDRCGQIHGSILPVWLRLHCGDLADKHRPELVRSGIIPTCPSCGRNIGGCGELIECWNCDDGLLCPKCSDTGKYTSGLCGDCGCDEIRMVKRMFKA